MMEYDSESDLIIIVGGQEGAHNNGDILLDSAVWTYDVNSNNWTEVSNLLPPPSTFSPTPTTPSSTPTSPPPPPIELIVIIGGSAVVIVIVILGVKLKR
jgi:hypothetical protein